MAWLDSPDPDDLCRWSGRDFLVGVRFKPGGRALAFGASRGRVRLGRQVSERDPDDVREDLVEVEEIMSDLRAEAQGEGQR